MPDEDLAKKLRRPRSAVLERLRFPLLLDRGELLAKGEQLAAMSEPRAIHFPWRPFLRDPDDDMLVELAVAGRATHIVTFNLADFEGVNRAFGIQTVTPAQLLASLKLTT